MFCTLQIYCWGQPCNGLASHPGGNRITPSHFYAIEIGEKCQLVGPLGQMQTRKSLRERCNIVVVSVFNPRFQYGCRPVLQSLVGGGHSPEMGLFIC